MKALLEEILYQNQDTLNMQMQEIPQAPPGNDARNLNPYMNKDILNKTKDNKDVLIGCNL